MADILTTCVGHLAPFDARDAGIVASWVRNDAELFLLAPSTPAPLTAAKVIAWTRTPGHCQGQPLTFREHATGPAVGYAELNPLKRDPGDLWIGHVVIDPARRGEGLGAMLTRALVHRAFDVLGAHRLTLVVFPNNLAAINCYHAVGFRTRREEFQRFATRRRRYCLLRMELTAREFADRSAASAPGSAIPARF